MMRLWRSPFSFQVTPSTSLGARPSPAPAPPAGLSRARAGVLPPLMAPAGNGTSGGGAYAPYCGDLLVDVHDVYVHYHGYASLLVCAFGSVANVLNIAVLTRKEMVSPTNAILTGLAVADLLVMVEYVPFAYHMYLRPADYPRADRFSYNWSLFVLLHSDFSQAFHTISIWLTVTLAVWR